MKNVGEPCAGKPHARIEAAAGGNRHQSASPHDAGASRRPYIELESRRVHLAGCTTNPTGAWVTQQARNLSFTGVFERMRFLIHDLDSKFTASFDEVFRSEGIKVIHTPFRAPQANAYAERFVRTVRNECLDWLLMATPEGKQSISGFRAPLLSLRSTGEEEATVPRFRWRVRHPFY